MAFRFPLATLLRLREIAEQREERLLGQILNQIVQARQTLADLTAERARHIAQREAALREATSAFDLMGSYDRIRVIVELERVGHEHLAKLLTLREQQMEMYEIAHRNMELLSGMKGDRLETFQKEQFRKEQNAMDDNFSSRRVLPRQGLPGK